MKIGFVRLSKEGFKSFLEKDGLSFDVKTYKVNDKLGRCEGKISGKTSHICDRCGDEFELSLDEDIQVFLSDGLYSASENELENIIEFFDGFMDFEEVFISELEAIKSDYFYCKKCTN